MNEKEPWHAATLHWTLNVGSLPVYVIRPEGPFAGGLRPSAAIFRRAVSAEGRADRRSRRDHGPGDPAQRPARASDQSRLEGAVQLADGRVDRCGAQLPRRCSASGNAEELRPLIREFLDRIYFELRNAGRTPQERALNYAGTNLVSLKQFLGMLHSRRTLDMIRVDRSSVCRPSSDCWDITVSFFDPEQPNCASSLKSLSRRRSAPRLSPAKPSAPCARTSLPSVMAAISPANAKAARKAKVGQEAHEAHRAKVLYIPQEHSQLFCESAKSSRNSFSGSSPGSRTP